MNWFKSSCVMFIAILLVSGSASSSDRELEFETTRRKLNKSIVKLNQSMENFAVSHDCGMALLLKFQENHSEEYKKLLSSISLDAGEELTRDLMDLSCSFIEPFYTNLTDSEKQSLFKNLKNANIVKQSYPICINSLGANCYADYVTTVRNFSSDVTNEKRYGKPGIGDIAKVDILNVSLFEAGDRTVEHDNRSYSTKFQKDTTRKIWIELKVKNISRKDLHRHKVVWTWYNLDESVRGRMVSIFIIKPEWETSWIERGWGWQEPGKWGKGTYKVELTIDDKTIEKQFTIF